MIFIVVVCVGCLLIHRYYSIPDEEKTVSVDLDRDGNEEEIVQNGTNLTLYRTMHSEREEIYAFSSDWDIQDFLIGDINGDETDELLVLLWREGNYGQYRPFWEEEEDTAYTQHIYIYQLQEGNALKTLWMSSGLKPEVDTWQMNEEGTIQILTTEGEDTTWRYSPVGQGFGLERIQ